MPRPGNLDITGPILRAAMYNTAVQRGLIRQGDELRLDVDRAADLLGVKKPRVKLERDEATHVGHILGWMKDNPDESAWLQQTLGAERVVIYLRPRAYPARGDAKEGEAA
ncbi:MAG: hypothetical protein QOE90_1528 [Thermoplasmata archaeon]|jgi:hypothetical protein|nr:hypothetical protein [Thermoplasmata archaeon]